MNFSRMGGELPTIVPNADLSALNTLGVPARAAFFAQVDSVESLQALLRWRKSQAQEGGELLPIMVLGGGSNIVLNGDFSGLVIHMGIEGREELEESDDAIWVRVGAGENWHKWVSHCLSFHYWGLENLALIPGTVGAAPIQNIGAYGVEVESYIDELSAVDIQSGLSVTFDKNACQFGYRDSVFKQHLRDRYIITSVTFRLQQEPTARCDYPALREQLTEWGIESPTPQQVFDAVCAVRRSKLPDPDEIPNAGSFFKNPMVDAGQFQQLQQQHPAMVGYPQADGSVKLAAGWLIDQAGWKGYFGDGVGVHAQQALVLINPGHETGDAILQLARDIAADVKRRFGVDLEMEPRVYG